MIGPVVGAVLGAVFGGAVFAGSAAGAGVAAGLSAGICSTLQAAEEEELHTAADVDQVLDRTAADTAALVGSEPLESSVGSADDCAVVMDRLHATSER